MCPPCLRDEHKGCIQGVTRCEDCGCLRSAQYRAAVSHTIWPKDVPPTKT